MQKNGPKLRIIAIKATILHTFGVQILSGNIISLYCLRFRV